jgi:hypothetical protein
MVSPRGDKTKKLDIMIFFLWFFFDLCEPGRESRTTGAVEMIIQSLDSRFDTLQTEWKKELPVQVDNVALMWLLPQ